MVLRTLIWILLSGGISSFDFEDSCTEIGLLEDGLAFTWLMSDDVIGEAGRSTEGERFLGSDLESNLFPVISKALYTNLTFGKYQNYPYTHCSS